MVILRTVALATMLALAAQGASAHVSASPNEAKAGAYEVVHFRIGHGCNDVHATTALRIEIPDGMPAARPQPKPGWTLTIEHASGQPQGAVTAIVWRGRLPADQFDEFAVMFQLPKSAGPLYFPTVQTCDGDEAQWTEIPAPGETGVTHPAPRLQLAPAGAPDPGHVH